MSWWWFAVVAVVIVLVLKPYYRDVVKYHDEVENNELVAVAASHIKLAFIRVTLNKGGSRRFGDINPGVWREHYLLGYAGGFSVLLAKQTHPHYTDEMAGQVVFDAFRLIDPDEGQKATDLMINLVKSKSPSFLKGFGDGVKVAEAGPVLSGDLMFEYMDNCSL